MTRPTIAAIATPPGRGGVGIVRVSGPRAREIGLALSRRAELSPRYCHYATFRDSDGKLLDKGLILYFPGPYSYTGEDTVELQGHGGPAVMENLLRAVLATGAEQAGPGEFTKRAHLNDRIDLTQAEAIASLIEAEDRSAARAALRSLEGELGRQVKDLAGALSDVRVYVEGALDFPDEDVDFLADGQVLGRIDDLRNRVIQLRARADQGARLGRGYRVVLTGRPNAGKSSLLNALAGRDAAIVTEQGGTTRDVLRESVEVGGLPVELLDTAGLRVSEDRVEREGVRRAREHFEGADLIVYLVDAGEGWTEEDSREWEQLPRGRSVSLWSKADRAPAPLSGHWVSVVGGPGVEPLIELLRDRLGEEEGQDAFGARERHVQALDRVQDRLEGARVSLTDHGSGDLVAQDLRWAQEALGEITGKVHSDDLLDRVFATFCIGK